MSTANGRPTAGTLPGATMLPPVGQTATDRPPARQRSRGRFAEINGFIDFALADLTPSAVAVWLILWRDTKPDGLARTGQADMARRAGVTDRAVRKALGELTAGGLVKVVRQGRAGVGPSSYRVRGGEPCSAWVTGTGGPAATGTGGPFSAERQFRYPRMGP